MRNAVLVSFAVASLLLPFAADAASTARSDYEVVLLPMLTLPVKTGANGSLWSTEFVGHNNGTASVDAFQSFDAATCAECPFKPIPGGSDFHLRPTSDARNAANPGVLLYVQKSVAPSLSYSLRLRELSQQPNDFVELPVVHESELATGTTRFLDVPHTDASRVHLRIYGISSPSGAGVVNVRFLLGNVQVYQQLVALTPANGAALLANDTMFVTNPAYGEIANATSVRPFTGTDSLRIEVDPVTDGLRYWAFLSVTNNATQRVSLITPQ